METFSILPEPADRQMLMSLAFRLLGSVSDSEDAVQEALTRWYGLPVAQRQQIQVPAAWFARVTGRICLDLLRSARRRRETYVGSTDVELVSDRAPQIFGAAPPDPAGWAVVDESLTIAAHALLESGTPAQRVVFVLHDVCGYPFSEIARITGRSSAACRKLAICARRGLRSAGHHRRCGSGEYREPVRRFKEALRSGDVDRILAVLDRDAKVVRVSPAAHR
ncbi:sigma factor [Mycolicibacter minnesotensis]